MDFRRQFFEIIIIFIKTALASRGLIKKKDIQISDSWASFFLIQWLEASARKLKKCIVRIMALHKLLFSLAMMVSGETAPDYTLIE